MPIPVPHRQISCYVIVSAVLLHTTVPYASSFRRQKVRESLSLDTKSPFTAPLCLEADLGSDNTGFPYFERPAFPRNCLPFRFVVFSQEMTPHCSQSSHFRSGTTEEFFSRTSSLLGCYQRLPRSRRRPQLEGLKDPSWPATPSSAATTVFLAHAAVPQSSHGTSFHWTELWIVEVSHRHLPFVNWYELPAGSRFRRQPQRPDCARIVEDVSSTPILRQLYYQILLR